MKYTFTLTKNIFMYNHLLKCSDGKNTYEAICESAPFKDDTMIYWPDDFNIPLCDNDIFIEELKEWSIKQGYKYIINEGKGR